MPLEMMLTDYEKSPIYVFFDDNQNLYSRASSFPIKDEPFALTANCRNTDKIHEAAYRFYRGEGVVPPGIDGEPVATIEAPSFKAQATKIHARIVELITKDRIPAGDIAILILSNEQKTDYYEAIRHMALPAPNKWIEEGRQTKETILLDTVSRFKGLEAPIVFLWGLDGKSVEKNREQFYVGLSRAKSLLFVCGTPEICTSVLS
jgi:superfamily I DNA/RNA helicase